MNEKPELRFTVRAWKRFSPDAQQTLLKKFDVILIDYMTRKEKTIKILKKFNARNLNRGIAKFNRGVDGFHNALNEFDKAMGNRSKA